MRIQLKHHHLRKKASKLWKILSFFQHLYFLLKYLLNRHFLQIEMNTWLHFFHKTISLSNHNSSLSMFPTDYTFRLYDKNKISSLQLLLKSCLHTNTGLIMEWKSSLSNSTFYAHQSIISKQMNVILLFSQLLKKFLIIRHTLNFFNIQNHRTTFSSITSTFRRIPWPICTVYIILVKLATFVTMIL